eukprot:gene8376-9951_t
MGNALVNKRSTIPPLLDETQIFALWTIEDLKELLKRFHSQIHGFAIVEAQFESILAFKPNMGDRVPLELLFDILDNDHDGRIDGLELLGGLTLVCHATFEEKARFCFELFDFNLNSTLSKKELIMMMMSSVCGMNLLTGGSEELEPDLEVFEALAEDAILRADKNSDNQISYEEFLYWARSNRDLMAGLEAMNKVSLEAKIDIDPEDSAPETDDGDLSETDLGIRKREKKAEGVIVKSAPSLPTWKDKMLVATRGDESQQVSPWLGQVFEPTNHKKQKSRNDGPDTNLELSWAFGYHSADSRNNVHYLGGTGVSFAQRQIVYYTAALGVVFNPTTKKQTFYMGHSDEVSCIALHPGKQIVATGDVKSNVHIWHLDGNGAATALCVMTGIVKEGVMHLAFAPAGDRIVSIGRDNDHTVCIHSVNSGEIIASTQGLQSPNTVFNIAYSTDGTELALVGRQQIKFCTGVHSQKRAIDSHMGKIGSQGKRQTFLSVVYFKDDCIVGCASGEIYRFREGQCVDIVQAHGPREPVLCMYYNQEDGTLITGGKDYLIKTWDSTLKAVGESIDISEDVDSDGRADSGSLDCAVVSLERWDRSILLGTRGGDIFEATLPHNPGEAHTLSRIAWSHPKGELWGLAVHPLRDEFATAGDDKTVRIWSIRSHEQLNVRVMPEGSRALAYSPNGEILCLGMMDGSMALMESQNPNLRVYATWRHSDVIITAVKFSPCGTYIAAGSGDMNIYIYKSDNKKTYQRQAVCRGHAGSITHLDFSANSQYIQSNGLDYALMFWDIEGNQVKKSVSLRDTTWATLTCPLSWPVQGIWPAGADYSDINSCQAMPDLGDIVTGDDFGKVKLFKYPALKLGALHQTYVGHAGHVTCVRFTSSRRFMVSIGGADRTILVWRHDVELCESDVEGHYGAASDASSATASSADEAGATGDGVDARLEIADVGPRSLEQEAVNLGWTVKDLKEFGSLKKSDGSKSNLEEAAAGDQSGAPGDAAQVEPWKAMVVEPSAWKSTPGATDVDLALKWVHGYRAYDCRNNVLYSASGSIVYNAASMAVVYNKGAGKQQFLQGAHTDEVVSICCHPAGQIFATGEAGRQPSIIIWNSKEMEVLGKIQQAHSRGIPLLAFNSTGKLLASIGLDENSSLCLHEWLKGVEILRTPTNKGKVLALCFLASDPPSVDGSGGNLSTGTLSNLANPTVGSTARDIVVTAGERHLQFWWAQGQNVQSQRALWGRYRKAKRSTIMCVASANADICITGNASGGLVIWEKFKAVCDVREYIAQHESPEHMHVDPHDPSVDHSMEPVGGYPHKSTIQCIYAIPGRIEEKNSTSECLEGYQTSSRYLTGDKAGNVCIWRMVRTVAGKNLRLVLMKTFNVLQLKPTPLGVSVRSVCMRDGMILLGLLSSEILEVIEGSLPFLISRHRAETPFAGTLRLPLSAPNTPMPGSDSRTSLALPTSSVVIPSNRLVIGHSVSEVWGLAMHPSLPVFLTSGDDCTVKCWNLSSQKLISYLILPDKCRAVAFEPRDAGSFALALNSGVIWVISSEILFGKKSSMLDLSLDGVNMTSRLGLAAEVPPPAGGEDKGTTNAALPPLPPSWMTKCAPRVLTGPTQWVQVLKYSFDGSLLGAGSHDHNLYLYDVRADYAPLLKDAKDANSKIVLADHTSFVSHFDFGLLLKNVTTIADDVSKTLPDGTVETTSVATTDSETYDPESNMVILTKSTNTIVSITSATDPNTVLDVHVSNTAEPPIPQPIKRENICIQSCSGAAELLFWRADGTRVFSASFMKDAWWSSFSCPYGWPVQGIWPTEADGTEINAVARSHTWEKVPTLATADNFGRVRLYNYPCVTVGASDKCYRGHASDITRVEFSYDDAYCVTIGAKDKCVFVWATDIQDEIRERAAYSSNAVSIGLPLETVDENEELAVEAVEPAQEEDNFNVFKMPAGGGDQSGAIKPWKGAVREPSNWVEPEDIGEEPDASLELKFVYGYRGWDCRNNISFADSRFEILYHVAGVGVVFNSKENKQLHNTEHDDYILCLAVHPEGHTVATGEIGKFPKIVLWDANTGVTIRVIQFHKRGVANIAFSANGELLVSTGLDDDRTVVVHNVRTGSVLGKGKAGRGIDVYTVCVGGNASFVTGGKNHVKFWELPQTNSPGGELSSKSGIYNLKAIKERTVVSGAYLGSDAVTGMKDGNILLWKDRANTKYCQAHDGPVTAMYSINNDSPGIDTRELGPRVITGGKDGFVHIWDLQLKKMWSLNLNETSPLSACPQIKAVATKENRLLIGTQASEIYEVSLLSNAEVYRHVQGHYETRSEVWGVATHPTLQRFVTCGDDMTVRLWDAKALQQIEIVHVGAKVRAVAISPDGTQVAVGTFEGKILVLSSNLQKEEAQVTVSNSWTEVIQYSPDGKLLAVGSHDNTIYLLETRAYACKFKCKGHHSYITGLDFSADGTTMQTVSGDYELLFWNCLTGKQIVSPTEVRDVKWATFTCKLGWPVQGVWPANADGTDVNSVDRSPDGKYLVSGDDFLRVKLFQYPCTREKSKFKAYKGHAEHVLRVRFSFDGKYVFSVGGLDKAVMQYELKHDSGSKRQKKLLKN